MKRRLADLFNKNRFLASFSMLASGSIIAQIIAMLSSPITTRLYSPEQFGKYTIIATAVSIFGPVISLKYDMAIVIADKKKESNTLIKLSFLITLALSTIIGFIYGILFFVDDLLLIEKIIYIIATIILLIAYGINNILLAHNNKNGLYKLISTVTIVKSTVNNFLVIVFGLLRPGIIGLVGGQLISSFAGVMRQSKGLRNELSDILEISLNEMKRAFRKYIRQPIYNASSALVTTTVYSSINLFVKIVYTYEQLGLYSLSYRVLGIPFTVISANIARIFYDTASKENIAEKNFHKTFISTLKILIITVVPIITIIAAISPLIFSIVFGDEWMIAGEYVRLLSPMFAIRLIAESLTTTFIISGKQQVELLFQVTLLIGELIIFMVAHFLSLDLSISLLVISFLYVFIYGVMIFTMNKLSKETK